MTTRACIFPGQGSQEIGMGRGLYDAFPAAREVFEEVDDALSQHLSGLMFDGEAETLTLTENAQPAIMACSMAAFRVLQREGGFSLQTQAAFVAGHSLGEYSALCAAGALSLSDTARLLRLRGKAMQEAAPAGSGMMAAILGMEIEAVESMLADLPEGKVCEIANDNAPGQIVISGEREAVEQAMDAAKAQGAKRAMTLNVSAPFHSSLIRAAADRMEEALAGTTIVAPSVPLIANVTAGPVREPETIRDLLVRQVTGRVRWRESVAYMRDQGVSELLEIGHGQVLSGLNRRIDRQLTSRTINGPDDIDALVKVA